MLTLWRIKDVFVHPLDDYDFVIHLKPSIHPRYYQNVQFDPHAWSKGEDGDTAVSHVGELTAPKVEFDPVKMLFDDLKVSTEYGFQACTTDLADFRILPSEPMQTLRCFFLILMAARLSPERSTHM